MKRKLDKIQLKFIFSCFILFIVLVLSLVSVYYWQHNKFNQANKQITKQTSQINNLNKQILGLNNSVSMLSNKLKNSTSSTPLFGMGDTQCIKSFCIKLDSTSILGPNPTPGIDRTGYTRFSVQLTVTNNGQTPEDVWNSKTGTGDFGLGIVSGSEIYTSDNAFLQVNNGQGEGTFAQQIPSYPPTGQTETGTIVFDVPPNISVDSYLYGNLTWIL